MTEDLSAYDGAAQDAYTAFHNTACGWEGLDEEERQCWRYAARSAIGRWLYDNRVLQRLDDVEAVLSLQSPNYGQNPINREEQG